MKLNTLVLITLGAAALTASACRWDPTDLILEVEGIEGGGLPGLGNNTEEVEGTDFQFPTGISVGTIPGYAGYSAAPAAVKPASMEELLLTPPTALYAAPAATLATTTADYTLGSGYYVRIVLPLTNSTPNPIEIELPAALIFQNSGGEYQNGLLVKKVKFTAKANGTTEVVLHLYCCNLSRHASDTEAVYNRFVVCTSEPIVRFCQLFKDKKINVEENPDDYDGQVTQIQSILWTLTQMGVFPTGENLDWINALPNS